MKIKKEKVLLFIFLFSIFIIAMLYRSRPHLFAIENFEEFKLGSMSGFGFESGTKDYPLFLNRYPLQLGTDFKLRSLIQKLKNVGSSDGIIRKSNIGNMTGIYTDGLGQINQGKPMIPIVLFPGLGISPILGRWNLDSTPIVKNFDNSNTFESNDKWSCKSTQDTWSSIWFPSNTPEQSSECWSFVAKVNGSENGPVNVTGVQTIIPNFGTIDFLNNYMSDLVKALEAVGYVKDSTLFAINYDHRKITNQNEFNELFQNFVSFLKDKEQVIIIGHDLGSVIANLLIQKLEPTFKEQKINKFISVNGSFGGCPKALRVFLSGETIQTNSIKNSSEQLLLRDTVNNYSGLHLLLPSPKIYQEPLLEFNSKKYYSQDIPKLISLNFPYNPDTKNLYEISLQYQDNSLNAPGVPVYIFGSLNLNTESNFVYSNSLSDDPLKLTPSYNLFEGNQNSFEFNNLQRINTMYNGDGTMTELGLKYPLKWAKQQKQPVTFKFYNELEHVKILSSYEFVYDLLKVLGH